jgi:hypothetical protein
MSTPSASPWSRAALSMRERVDSAMDHMADLIKDALLDGLEFSDEDEGAVAPLVPLSPDQFVERMRPRVDRTLRQLAQALNAAGDESPAANDERTSELFHELWLEALKVAAQLRLESTLVEELPEVELPQGEWARRYRRMQTEDGFDEGIR